MGDYGRLDEEKLDELFEQLERSARRPMSEPAGSQADKLLLGCHEHRLSPGSAEFIKAQTQHVKRMSAYSGAGHKAAVPQGPGQRGRDGAS